MTLVMYGTFITSQTTGVSSVETNDDTITVWTRFYQMRQSVPTPRRFILLRLANLTVMRNLWLGNRVKDLLVRTLITGRRAAPLTLTPGCVMARDS
jgi:hypothetical protein